VLGHRGKVSRPRPAAKTLTTDSAQYSARRPRYRDPTLRRARHRKDLRPELRRIETLSSRAEGPALAARALTAALAQANIKATDLDALLICTCTGYLCPGLTSYVSEQLGLRTDAILQDLVGLGCGAAIPTLRAASHVLAAQPGATVACIAVEICSASSFSMTTPA
jgi:3-oxoacyl-[acyl-carrier-protein] synthase III